MFDTWRCRLILFILVNLDVINCMQFKKKEIWVNRAAAGNPMRLNMYAIMNNVQPWLLAQARTVGTERWIQLLWVVKSKITNHFQVANAFYIQNTTPLYNCLPEDSSPQGTAKCFGWDDFLLKFPYEIGKYFI